MCIKTRTMKAMLIMLATTATSALTSSSSLALTSNHAPLSRSKVHSSFLSNRVNSKSAVPTDHLHDGGHYLEAPTTEISVNGQKFNVVLALPGGDTWLIQKGFKCLNTGYPNNVSEPVNGCKIRREFDGDFPNGPIPDTNFNPFYGAGWELYGEAGYLEVDVAGLHVNQTIGLVSSGWWNEGFSGVLGLAYPLNQLLFAGTDASKNVPFSGDGTEPGDQHNYEPLVSSMVNQSLIKEQYFSLALQRPRGGYIAFGGLPPVNITGDFVTVPIQNMTAYDEYVANPHLGYGEFLIDPQGYTVTSASNTNTTFKHNTVQAVFDTTQPWSEFPPAVYAALVAAIPVPLVQGQVNHTFGLEYLPCDTDVSELPMLGVKIGGRLFKIDRRDLILQDFNTYVDGRTGVKMCPLGADPYGVGLVTLGGNFLNNVVAVFDTGRNLVSLAAHEY